MLLAWAEWADLALACSIVERARHLRILPTTILFLTKGRPIVAKRNISLVSPTGMPADPTG
jgi:hypothetical protein